VTPLLETQGLTVTYGGVRANSNVTLTVDEGRCVGLIGANGAGKTTFVDAITGFARVASGSVWFGDTDITQQRADRRARLGLVRTFQSLELFDDMTVWDNVLVACEQARWWDFVPVPRARRQRVAERAHEALQTVGIDHVKDALPEHLSHGQRKLVGIARALAGSPKLLLLDEPAAGLDRNESAALGRTLRRLVDGGLTIFLIDHDMGLVLSVCDAIYVLDFGKIVAQGNPAAIRTDPNVIAAYLGDSAEPATPQDSIPTDGAEGGL
jgi:branched-chain amino acid transport system ATP-binding protein